MDKKVVVIGGTGGLGQAYVQAFLSQNYDVFIGCRQVHKLQNTFDLTNKHLFFSYIDLSDYSSVVAFAKEVQKTFGLIDYVINSTGYDVRKTLDSHTQKDIDLSLDINLRGSIYIVKAFLPIMNPKTGSTIVNMGGFIDGGLAFPYYSVDVASRAGIFSFTESMNRELKQENNPVRITYFCPNIADTDAELP